MSKNTKNIFFKNRLVIWNCQSRLLYFHAYMKSSFDLNTEPAFFSFGLSEGELIILPTGLVPVTTLNLGQPRSRKPWNNFPHN